MAQLGRDPLHSNGYRRSQVLPTPSLMRMRSVVQIHVCPLGRSEWLPSASGHLVEEIAEQFSESVWLLQVGEMGGAFEYF